VEKTASGFDENVAGALCYALGWLTGIVFLLREPKNRFVRFHAWQSVLLFGPACVLWFVFLSIPFVGWVVSLLVFYTSAVLWLILMYKAYQGEKFKIVVVGEMAEQRAAGSI
jgi:uncharacterized membrane protein